MRLRRRTVKLRPGMNNRGACGHERSRTIAGVRVRLGRRLLVCAALVVPLAGGPFQEARADCREVAEPLQQALKARDLDAARRHYDAVQNEFDCPDDTHRAKAGRALSDLHAHVARERLAGGASLASQRALLERGRAYAGTWPTLALLGDVAHDATSPTTRGLRPSGGAVPGGAGGDQQRGLHPGAAPVVPGSGSWTRAGRS